MSARRRFGVPFRVRVSLQTSQFRQGGLGMGETWRVVRSLAVLSHVLLGVPLHCSWSPGWTCRRGSGLPRFEKAEPGWGVGALDASLFRAAGLLSSVVSASYLASPAFVN